MAKLVIFTLLSLASTAWGYSAGAPAGVCDDMTPKHLLPPRSSRFPYKVSIDKTEVKPGDEVAINITDKVFKGFFLQVRDEKKNAVGTFKIPADDKFFKTVDCHGTKGSAATHKNSIEKKDIFVTWKAPEAAGKYTVFATVAQDGGTYWAAKPSGTIKVE